MHRLMAVISVRLTLPAPLLAWGPEGHRMIADVAEHHLTAAAKRQVPDLLGNDDLASISTWAEIKN